MADNDCIGMFRLRALNETTSTNDEIKRALEADEPEGLAISAHVQTAGYGRHGHTWLSPRGGLYVSCLLRPTASDKHLPTLSLVSAIAVRRAVTKLIGEQENLLIKWPNDVIYRDVSSKPAQDLKLCGISLETHAGGVCVGIGMNVLRADQGEIPVQQGFAMGYLYDLVPTGTSAPSIDEVCACVLAELSRAYETWQAQGFSAFSAEYEACASLTNRHVVLRDIDDTSGVAGIVQGIDEDGRLRIWLDDQEGSAAFASGEVHVYADEC